MLEKLPEPAQERAEIYTDQEALEVDKPQQERAFSLAADTHLTKSAKITVPLPVLEEHVPRNILPRSTRPLTVGEPDSSTISSLLPVSIEQAKITRPLAESATERQTGATSATIVILAPISPANIPPNQPAQTPEPTLPLPAPLAELPVSPELVPTAIALPDPSRGPASPTLPGVSESLSEPEPSSEPTLFVVREAVPAPEQGRPEGPCVPIAQAAVEADISSERTQALESRGAEIADIASEATRILATISVADDEDASEKTDPALPAVRKARPEQAEQTMVSSPTLLRPPAPLAPPTPPALALPWPTIATGAPVTPAPCGLPRMPSQTPAPISPVPRPAQRQVATLPQYSYTKRRSPRESQRLKRLYRLQYFARKHMRQARASERQQSQRLWTTIWSTATSILLILIVLSGVGTYIAYNFVVATQGTYAGQVLTLRNLLPPDNLKIYDTTGKLIDQMIDQGIHTEVTYQQIASDLVDATVAIEDHTFWQNSGVDITGIMRAAIADLNSGQQVQGGSTITQQLIKQLIVGSSDDTLRKLNEVVLAPQVNNHYTKKDIMEMYLNTIYYGHQAYGIDAAATVFFGLEDKKDQSAASQLNLAQSAFLAGLPRNASFYDPAVNFADASSRCYDVLQAMVAQGYITQIQAQNAYQETQARDFFRSSPTLQDQAPHFDEYILSQLESMYHLKRAQLSRSGLVVSTTVNVTLQNQILKIMQQHIAEIRAAHNVNNAAEVLIDFHTGAIISMLGSIDYYNTAIDGQYNVALAYRQPGSSFKPYVYVTAFEQGASPAQAVDDAKTTFSVPGSNPPTYTPANYDLGYHGHMTLRCALQNSLNIPAVRVLQHVGIANAMNTAQAMGITSYGGTPGLSLVLGGLDVRLLDHTSAYGVFANGGVRQPSYSISKIVKGTTGKVLYQHAASAGTRVLAQQLAYMMTSVLSDNTSRIPEFFDCNVLQLYANSQQSCYEGDRGAVRPAAVKTGTTQDFRDNWTVGYTTDYVMGVWAGNDNNAPMINVTGVQGAAPIWHDSMLLAEKGHPMRDFQNPGGLVRATITYPDGVKSTDWYLPGTVPSSKPGQSTPTETGQPGQGGDKEPATTTPYCSTFSYAFQPPAAGGIPANGQWW